MRSILSAAFFIAAIVCFIWFFWLTKRLAPERVAPPTAKQFRTGWIPGTFTPAGERTRRRMTILIVVGFVFLALGMVTFFLPAS